MEEHGHFLGGLGEVSGEGHVEGFGAGIGESVEIGGGGEGGVWAEAKIIERIFPRFEEGEGSRDDIVGGEAMADIDHFVEPPSADGGRAEEGHEFGEGFDIADGGGAPALEFGEALLDGGEVILAIERAFDGVDALDPGGETVGWEDGVAHHRVIEMAVGIDQAWEEDDLAEVGDLAGVGGEDLGGGTDRGDPIIFDHDRAVLDGGTVHGNDRAGAEDHEGVAAAARSACLTTSRAWATRRLQASWQRRGRVEGGGRGGEGRSEISQRRIFRQPEQVESTSARAWGSVIFWVTRYMPVWRERVSRRVTGVREWWE